MKRIVLLAMLFALVCNVSMAQDKPTKGSFSTEVNFKPFESNGNMFSLEDGYALKVRYFLNEESALRFKLGFARDAKTYTYDYSKNGSSTEKEMSARWGDFSLNFGYEHHFDIAPRVNLYVGGEFGIYRHFASADAETTSRYEGSYEKYYRKDSYEYTNYIPSDGVDLGVEPDQAYFGIAANVFAGLDFYVYKGFYIGTELGFSINSHKTSDREMEYSWSKETSSKYSGYWKTSNDGDSEKTEFYDNTRTTSIKFRIEPAIRLGLTF